ncbi:ATP-binding protein [Streptomyces sp. NPDC004082]|uniref:ATP-binding protein n=1 Tax=unclassified Streptomyces TaxID=2593676 RepID=UPI0033B1DC20
MRIHVRLLRSRSPRPRPLRLRQLHPYPRNVPLARRRVARLAAEWGHPGAAGDAALLAGELCANALLHGCLRDRLFRVETSLTGQVLRVAVTDPRGERLPRLRTAEDDDQFGRGLLIVGLLAARWSVRRLPVGKTVWAELDVPGTPGPERLAGPPP